MTTAAAAAAAACHAIAFTSQCFEAYDEILGWLEVG
jgi:hypothetical protein